jgi:hypothetical protein
MIPVDAPWHYTSFWDLTGEFLELEREIVAREFGARLRGNVSADTLGFSLRSYSGGERSQHAHIRGSDFGFRFGKVEGARGTGSPNR